MSTLKACPPDIFVAGNKGMTHKYTVAIIGAPGSLGILIAKDLSEYYRLLLMDDNDQSGLKALQSAILELDGDNEVDVLDCCKDASWEADIIVIAVSVDKQSEIAIKIKEVATQKVVISISSQIISELDLQTLLPHSKVISFFIGADHQQIYDIHKIINASRVSNRIRARFSMLPPYKSVR